MKITPVLPAPARYSSKDAPIRNRRRLHARLATLAMSAVIATPLVFGSTAHAGFNAGTNHIESFGECSVFRNTVLAQVSFGGNGNRQEFRVGTRVYRQNGTYYDLPSYVWTRAGAPFEWQAFTGPKPPVGLYYANWIEYRELSSTGWQTGFEWVRKDNGSYFCKG